MKPMKDTNLDYEWRFWVMLALISPFIVATSIACFFDDLKKSRVPQ